MIPPLKLSHRPTRQFWEIPVLHEDDHVLALEKPADLPASPLLEDPEYPALISLLHEAIRAGAAWAVTRGLELVSTVQRVDPETTGVLLLAKGAAAQSHLSNQFGSESPHVVCLALVEGSPVEDTFTVELRLSPDRGRPGYVRADPHSGRRAITQFTLTERFTHHALLRCEPRTQRPHQMRVHLRSRGLPVCGDAAYGGRPLLLSSLKPDYRFKQDRDELPLIGRAALHLEELTVKHPATGEPLTLRSALPKDFAVALKYLRRYAPVP